VSMAHAALFGVGGYAVAVRLFTSSTPTAILGWAGTTNLAFVRALAIAITAAVAA